MKPLLPKARRLQAAINYKLKDGKLCMTQRQWYSHEKDAVCSTFTMCLQTYDEAKRDYIKTNLYSTSSVIKLIKWLSDYYKNLCGLREETNGTKDE
jgi:hypothetical protein